MTPQIQMAYYGVEFDDFTDEFDADVSIGSSNSLTSRMGISARRDNEWKDENGTSFILYT
ncbi:autotransporter outer membrane beta-barrel domain-containing protein, partial [Brucella oryzae]|uniref:autotransporter outer membrane beta-barrel domain-containing protein n=1 Tax=Brucella oryzae TaxID=335286 RepID=UPI003CC9F7A4